MRRVEPSFSIRTAMIVLACASLIAALAIAVLAAWASYRENRQRVESSLIAATRAVMLSVDSELNQALSFVNGFSRSASLRRGDFVAFQKVATDALEQRGYLLIIRSTDGAQEYVNTSRTPSELRSAPTDTGLQLGLAGKAYLHQIDGRWMAVIDVPIDDASGKPIYTMTIGVPNGIFQQILVQQRLPQNWKPVILDADWRIVARGESLEKYVGHKGAGEEFRNSPTDRTHEIHILEGAPSISAHSQSSRYGWTTAIAVTRPASLLLIAGTNCPAVSVKA